MKRTNCSITNNIVYVEPNYMNSISGYGSNGLNVYELAPPLEDYTIYVNLEVETRGRNIQTSKSSNSKRIILSFTSSTNGKSSVNFMQGSKIPIGKNGATINSLTTNYTDIFISDLKKNGPSTEMFGIESIDIAYNNFMVPEVTIEFIDIRGVSLFAQKEYYETNKNIDEAINGENNVDIANTFFQCFFTFPYPKFNLLVKGFYGHPVTYELTCADFRARFDSRTGNFACTAKFVGYYFSFLNDAMINGIMASPYSDYIGADYWEKREFKIRGLEGGEVNMPKLGELLKKVKYIEAHVEKEKQSDPVVQERVMLDEKTNYFQDIEAKYNNYSNRIRDAVLKKYNNEELFFYETTNNGFIRSAVILSNSNNNELFGKFFDDVEEGAITQAYEDLKEYIEKYNANFSNGQLPLPDNIALQTPSQRIFYQQNDRTKATMYVGLNNDIKVNHYQLYNIFKDNIDNGNLEAVNHFLQYRSVYYYDDNKFVSTLERLIEENGKKVTDTEKKIESIVDEFIIKTLGFRPTVENLTRIIMAHFETFVRMIFETAKTICNESPARTISSLGVGDARSVSDVKNTSYSSDIVVPPFPKLVAEVKREGETVMEESWVGDYPGDFREKDLVHGLINGVKQVSKDIQSYDSSGETEAISGSEGRDSSIVKYPLSPIDLSATEKPYLSGGFDQNDVSSLLGLVALRAVNIFGANNFKEWENNARVLGIAEAHNFLTDNKLNKEITAKLSSLSGEDVINMLEGNSDRISRPGDGSKPWPWSLTVNAGKDALLASNGDLNVCKTQSGGFVLPYQNLSWEKINSETLNSNDAEKAKKSPDYLNSFEGEHKSNIFTLDTNIDRFASIVENQLNNLEGIDYYRDKFLNECKYSRTKYNNFFRTGNGKIVTFALENASNIIPYDESCILPISEEGFSNFSFGSGYNMNKFYEKNIGWVTKDGENIERNGDDGIKIYLSNPTTVGFTITEFPGLKKTLEPFVSAWNGSPEVSIFGQYLYYKEESVKSKALLFLASLGYIFNYNSILTSILNDDNTICIVPLPSIIFFGALLWSETDEGKKEIINYNTSFYNGCILDLHKLNDDVQNRFIKIFEHWIDNGIEGDSLIDSFTSIRGMELHFKNDMDAFFNNIGEIEDDGQTWFSTKFPGKNYNKIMDFFKGELTDDFFKNYITVDEDTEGTNTDEGGFTRGIRLGNRDGGGATIKATNFALTPCIFVKNSKFFKKDSSTNVNVNTGAVQSFFDGFLDTIRQKKLGNNYYGIQISQAKEPDDSNTDIKIGIYRYCKMIYDKWIAGLSDEEFEEKWTIESFFGNGINAKKNKYFYFVDTFYNTANEIPLGIQYFCDSLVSSYRDTQYSLLSFLSSIYSHNKFTFLCIQNFIDLSKRKYMESMFDTVAYTEQQNVNTHPNFIVLYNYETSNYLDIDDSDYKNDGFLINQEDNDKNKWPEPLKSRNAESNTYYNIPAFGVSYGKMYQSYFKDIDISMDSPTVTEQTIKAQFAIALQNSNGSDQASDRSKLFTYGQDLYSIYSNNSYTCNITMMGCAWVQPMMYFVLNNIPMFRGTYLIIKVSHHIEQGNMITKFTGVRMSNVCTRITRDYALRAKNNQEGIGETNGNPPEILNKLANIDNDCPYKVYPLSESDGYLSLSNDIMSNASQIIRAIMLKGYSKEQAAGIVGNMQIESPGLNPKTVVCDNKGFYSGGLCMWHKNSLEALINKDPKNVGTKKYNGFPCNSTDINNIKAKMPDALYQINFLLDSLEEDSYLKKRKVKENLLKETTPEGAAAVFAERYEACKYCNNRNSKTVKARMDYARNFYNNFREPNVTKISNNTDKHCSDLATGFLNALNKTAASSSNDIEIGVDSSKSSGDTLWLTNAKKNTKFSTVFDMILSAYSDKVSDIKWILPGNGQAQNSIPLAYLVTVKEGSGEAVNINVTSENSPNTQIGTVHVSNGDDDSGIHNHFCKALVKKYKSSTEELKKDTNNSLDDYNALFTDKKYEIKQCNDIMSESGFIETNSVPTEKENENGFIGNWNVGMFVERLHYWQKNICEHNDNGKKRQRDKRYGGCGWCTSVINRALRDSGLGMKYWDEMPWQVYNKLKNGSDFIEVRGAKSVPNTTEFSLGDVKKGDICVMWTTNKSKYHACAYDGTRWYSDYIQNSCNAYRGLKSCNMEWHLMRHK